jgi:hypothetical protein
MHGRMVVRITMDRYDRRGQVAGHVSSVEGSIHFVCPRSCPSARNGRFPASKLTVVLAEAGHKQAFERRTLQTFGRQQPSQSGLAISIATRMQETHASKQQFARVSEANALT